MKIDNFPFNQLYDLSPNLVAFTDLSSTIIYVNKKYAQLEGPDLVNYLGNSFSTLFPHQHCSSYWEKDIFAIKAGNSTTREISYRHIDGKIHTYLSTQAPLLGKNNKIIALGSNGVDITHYKNSQKKLEKAQLDLSLAQNVAGIGSWEWNLHNQEVFCSNETYDLLGISAENNNISTETFLNLIHPDDRAIVQYKLTAAIEKLELDNFEYRMLNQDRSYRHFQIFPRLEYDHRGKATRLFGLVHDITQQKMNTAEKLDIEKRVQQCQKIEALGKLTSGIAHEFNNVLTCILGYTDLSQRVLNNVKNEKLHRYINEIDIAGKNARDLVKQLLIFSHSSTGKPEPLSVKHIITDTLKVLAPILPTNITINLQLANQLPNILMDSAQLSQVIVNLCINARDTLRNGGQIDIFLNQYHSNHITCSSCQKLFHGSYIKLSIKDNGTGIQPGIISKIFDPYFSTKELGRGQGMGLSLTHGILHRYDGHIVVESEQNFGSTFHLFFPIITAEKSSP